MTSANAQAYVARVLGGATNTNKQAMALDALKATAEMWNLKNTWNFLLNQQSISVVGGTSRYTLNANFHKPYSARFTGTLKRPIRYLDQYLIDAVTNDQTTTSDPDVYTIIDDDADFSAASEVQKLQLFPTPRSNDTLLLRYYRVFSGTADPVDIPLRYLYTFLDCARIHMLMAHDSTNPRIPGMVVEMFGDYSGRIPGRFHLAVADDRRQGGNDQMEGFVTPSELAAGSMPTGPTDFYPRGDR